MSLNFSNFFKDKMILILGGTGSIGSEIASQLLKFNPKTIRILSNSENELWEAKLRFKDSAHKLRFLLGDIRNFERIKRATANIDIVFNAAAVKHVYFSEYNPMEAINVNIHGLENVIEAAFQSGVEKFINISTDKAVNPTTVMGASKMLGERLCISRELSKGNYKTIISCVRFGNVFGSRGSIIPLIKYQLEKGNVVTLTDKSMRRFFLSISQAVELVLKATMYAQGGEIFVLKMPVVYIKDLIEVIIEEYCPVIGKNPNSIQIKTIGATFGEKIDEQLISPIEFSSCYETNDLYIIHPLTYFGHSKYENAHIENGTKVVVDENFEYTTKKSTPLDKEKIREFLIKYNLIK